LTGQLFQINFCFIWNSHNNVVTKNIISNSWGSGITLIDSNNNTIKSNNFNSNTYACGIGLRFSNNTTVIYNNISNNTNGITISCSNLNTIASNNISSNKYHGIELYFSNNNTITVNNITTNKQNGICIDSSNNNNTIYHNNFINNSQNAFDEDKNIWDYGYSSCGNYWDDYNGKDNYSGSNQDIIGSDGVGDIPYDLSCEHAVDNYPLMKPYGMTKLTMFIGRVLFRFSGTIKDIGNKTAFNVQWKITIEGRKFIMGRNSSGTVTKPLLPDQEVTMNSKLVIGFGPVIITIAIWADNVPYVSEKIYGYLFFFYLIIYLCRKK